MVVALQDFWGHIQLGTYERVQLLGAALGILAEPKVNDLRLPIVIDNDVFGL